MADGTESHGEAREPRQKRPRDDSESPKPPTKRHSAAADETRRRYRSRSRSRSRHRERDRPRAGRNSFGGGQSQSTGRAPRSPLHSAPRDPRQSRDDGRPRDPPQSRDPPQNHNNEHSEAPPPKRRRPGASGGISKAAREAHLQQLAQQEAERKKREDEWAAQQSRRGIHNAVKEHYNLVPQRDREWRRTESRIKGLREFNNWIKSVMIQRFSPSLEAQAAHADGRYLRGGYDDRINVLDLGCGKGGDLFKWQKAPQKVGLYVGIDPADVSIEQARGRYLDARNKSRGRLFDAQFFARDGYGRWLGDEPFIQKVGIDPAVGPGGGGSARWGGGGFDVVSMMFCLHYSFEDENMARGMLRNAAGCLKKGGRLLGVMPSSDVIRSGLEKFYKDWDKKWAAKIKAEALKAEAEAKLNGDSATKPQKEEAKDSAAANAQPNGDFATKPEEEAAKESTEADAKSNSGSATKPQEEGAKDSADVPGSPAFVPDSPVYIPDSPTFAPESPGGAPAEEPVVETNGDAENPIAGPVEDVPEHPEPEWGNSIYHVRFPPKTPRNGIFRPMFGWKYQFKLEEAVEEVPEFIVPFEGFRALAEEYNLELTYSKPFMEIFEESRDDPELGPLSARMNVVNHVGGEMKMSAEEKEAAAFYLGFCFVKL